MCRQKTSECLILFDPPCFVQATNFNEWFLPPDTPLVIDTKMKDQKREPVLQVLHKWLTAILRPVTKKPFITPPPFLLEQHR